MYGYRFQRFFQLCETVGIAAAALLGAATFGKGLARATTAISALNTGEAMVYVIVGFIVCAVSAKAFYRRVRSGGTERADQRKQFAMIQEVSRGNISIEM